MPRPKSYFAHDQKLFTIEQTMNRLKEITGSRTLPQIDPMEPSKPVVPITVKPVVPTGYVAEPPTLEWLKPVKGTQISAGGAYEVLGRRSGAAFTYIARHGLNALGEPQVTAEAARALCLAHLREACA
jgi:hypothetical protein